MEVVTNFFSTWESLAVHGNLQISITMVAGSPTVVSMLFNHADPKGQSAGSIIPLTMSGSGVELDTHFFAEVMKPVQQTAAFTSNVAEYNKQLEAERAAERERRSQNAKSKGSAGGTSNQAKIAQERYDTFMSAVNKFATAKEFRQALNRLDKEGKQHPDFASRIANRRKEIMEFIMEKEGGMFGFEDNNITHPPATTEPPTSCNAPQTDAGSEEWEEELEDDELDEDESNPVADPFAAAPIED